MNVKFFREYALKFYLNASHYIITNGRRGESHPHTWELLLRIRIRRDSFVPFNVFENAVNKVLAPYQNQLLNDIPPFDAYIPTLESMMEYFADTLIHTVAEQGGMLTSLEGSETPARSYILKIPEERVDEQLTLEIQSELIDSVVNDILRER